MFLYNKYIFGIKYIRSVLTFICERNINKGLIFFRIFAANEIFKILFIKRKLIRNYHFINTYIVY